MPPGINRNIGREESSGPMFSLTKDLQVGEHKKCVYHHLLKQFFNYCTHERNIPEEIYSVSTTKIWGYFSIWENIMKIAPII
jgi:hypothetical protein